jgi:hypothetical protein
MIRLRLPLVFLPACACVTLTPQGARVAVYDVAPDAPADHARMPQGCRLVAAMPPVSMTELEIEGQRDPYRAARNAAAAAGANVVLVRRRLTVPRHDLDCPGSSPITDCPPSSGAWFSVVVESYACSPEALTRLGEAPQRSPTPPS